MVYWNNYPQWKQNQVHNCKHWNKCKWTNNKDRQQKEHKKYSKISTKTGHTYHQSNNRQEQIIVKLYNSNSFLLKMIRNNRIWIQSINRIEKENNSYREWKSIFNLNFLNIWLKSSIKNWNKGLSRAMGMKYKGLSKDGKAIYKRWICFIELCTSKYKLEDVRQTWRISLSNYKTLKKIKYDFTAILKSNKTFYLSPCDQF